MHVVGVFLLMAALGGNGAAGPDEDDLRRCLDGTDGDLKLHYCGRVLAGAELSPKDRALVLRTRALAWQRQAEPVRAVADYSAALSLEPDDAQALVGRSVAWAMAGELPRAVEDATRAIALAPASVDAHNVRGVALRQLRDYPGAIAEFDATLGIDSKHVPARVNRAELRRATGDDQGAIADYSAALRLRPQLWEAYAGRGGAWRRLGNSEAALADLNVSLELNPRSAQTLQDRGLAHFFLGHFPPAALDFTRANRVEPDAYRVIWSYISRSRAGVDARVSLSKEAQALKAEGWPALLLGALKDEAGEAALLAAAESTTNDALHTERACEAHFYIGQARLIAGAGPAARDHLQRARELCSPSFLEFEAAGVELARLAP